MEDAIRVAKYDKDQHDIVEIQWYTGNPHLRSSLQFGIVWDDGFQTRDYDADLANSQPFKTFVEARKELFPLQFTVKEARQKMKEIRQQVITSVSVGSTGYISLRVFDGTNNGWYDALQLPVKEKLYVVPYL